MNNRTYLITGATSGIGLNTAAHLLTAGHTVLITGRSQKNLDAAQSILQNRAHAYLADTANLKDIERLAALIKQNHDKLDGIFINAGIFAPAAFLETTEALFDETMSINFKGAFFTIQKLVPLLKNPAGIVLNTSLVLEKTFPNTAAYTASKGALAAIVGVLNVELAERGVRINIVSPGVTQSPIQRKAGMTDAQIHDMFADISQKIPLGRVVQPDDIAPVVEFLLSNKSIAMRGERLSVNGGMAL